MTPCAGHPELNFRDARAHAQAARSAGENVEVTRCTDCGAVVVAEPRSLDELEQLAARIRERSGNAPTIRQPDVREG